MTRPLGQAFAIVFAILAITAATGQAETNGRTPSRLIDDQWRFLRADARGADAVAFDDKTWEAVTLPHTWNVSDGSDGGNDYYRGPAWYRRKLVIEKADVAAGPRFYLRFGAASLVARVYVNGADVGEHRGGFAAFCFDVTDKLHAGENQLSVRVDNTRVDDVAPQNGDFTVFGGLYRDVELLTLEPLHISPIDDASPGVYLKQTAVSADSATIDVTTKLRNTSAANEPNATVTVEVVATKGESHATATTKTTIGAHTDGDVVTHLVIDKPQLWDGVRAPNLYTATVTVRNSAGKVVDMLRQPLGLRTIKIDRANGLALNGTRYPVRGVNIHQEVPRKGWAGSAKDYAQSYDLVREMGTTAVRMAHYQHNDFEYTLCDRSGMVVWAEVPLVDEFGKSPAFGDNVKQQLRELIKQNYNHPSIVVWGLWNELVAPIEDPNWNIVRDCNAMAHELDPSRPTTAAHHLKPEHGAVNLPDVIAFNRYAGWYGGEAAAWTHWIDDFLDATPGRAVALSEYGAGGSIDQHELNPARVKPFGSWHPEEYESEVHEQAWHAIKSKPDLWGSFVWNMFDFSVDRRHEGDHAGRNDKGLVTFDHQTRKDAFYFYQANWSDTPMVHITSERFEPYPPGPSTVKVYSNCKEVELSLNGKSLGKRVGVDGIFIWPEVHFVEGRTSLTATAINDGQTIIDNVKHNVSQSASTRTTPVTAPATKGQ